MIVHYLDKYNYVPLWVLVRILSFGKISKFYSFMKPKEQNAISKKYHLRINEFRVILHNLTLIRNICAHDEKLYDIKMKNRISSTIYHKRLKIEHKNGNYQLATRDLFSVIIILKMLLELNILLAFKLPEFTLRTLKLQLLELRFTQRDATHQLCPFIYFFCCCI